MMRDRLDMAFPGLITGILTGFIGTMFSLKLWILLFCWNMGLVLAITSILVKESSE